MGVNNLPEDALTAIAQEVEYRARELIQDASKFARHEHRDKLLVDDLNYALKARNLEVKESFANIYYSLSMDMTLWNPLPSEQSQIQPVSFTSQMRTWMWMKC